MDQPTPASSNKTTYTACLNCREKHVKCDGNLDGCNRCISLNLFCHYVPSRRGRKGQPSDQTLLYPYHISGIEDNDLSMEMCLPLTATDGTSPSYQVDHQSALSTADRYLIGIYYAHFHQAHPALPPRYVWAASSPPKYLVDLMECIGLHYLSSLPPSDRIRELRVAVDGAELSIEKTQAYLLLSVLLHGREIPDGARECIGHAIECSLQLGLHIPDFSNGIETQNPAIAESIRRTWWEILVIDTLLAAVQRGGTLQFRKEVPDMPLPRDEHSGDPTSSVTMKDMNRLGILTEHEHSPLAYRIEAALILRQCLIVHETHPSQESLDMLDATISAWFHRWPSKRKAIIQFNGEVNQMDFQAAMIMQLSTIYLHFPRSFLLTFLPNTCQVFCSGPPSFPSPTERPQIHTAKVVSAAVELSKLVSLSTSVINHSPFTGCSLVVSSIVQMAVLSSQAQQPFGKHHSFLAVNIGVLHSMGATWTIAATAMGRLRVIAYEIETACGGNEMLDNMPFLSILP
ncbi:hypothetical protein PHISCL_09821 [Aspergillus sclerotialis]|uniref:Zn(2)-C6 fungal-type domain-containing protein n=1 Tax=Aspergillus sclerotialis TaxID=2070753 RepID=A0A3A2Z4N7_9EURO|nr:hypothetical protein PHISCL_09821 [Aspergillus sclerotialis]